MAILEKRIVPSLALTFIVLSFYYGLQCGGGYSQIAYLAKMQRAYLKLLEYLGLYDEFSSAIRQNIQLLHAGLMLAELSSGKPATTIDLILRKIPISALQQKANLIDLKESVSKMIEEFE